MSDTTADFQISRKSVHLFSSGYMRTKMTREFRVIFGASVLEFLDQMNDKERIKEECLSYSKYR